jgi:hypothetical protein
MNPARRRGKRYPLLLYTRMLDRWWPALFLIGLGTMSLAWPFYSDLYTRLTAPWRWRIMLGAGGLVTAASLLMLLLRSSAYVQPLHDHLLLVTPFLRMRISYRRFKRTTTTVMAALFPPRSLRGLQRDILEPLFGGTAVVIDLNALPLPRSVLRLFLSPFFFKDTTPHIVILVREWMRFSTELESMRRDPTHKEYGIGASSSIMSNLPHR